MNNPLVIFGAFLIILIAISGVSLYGGLTTGEYQQKIINPLNAWWADVTRPAPSPSLAPLASNLPSITPSASPTPTPKPAVKTTTTTNSYTNCVRLNIREGEFASNKCYSEQDYDDLNYYLNQYSSAKSSVSFYQTKVNITCGNNDFHKTCEQDKADQQANLNNIPRYKAIIEGIIARGK